MRNKVVLLLWILFTFYLSSTSSIKVLEPDTWLNPTIYSDNVSLLDVLDVKSTFYWTYTEDNQSVMELSEEFYARKVGHCILYSVLSLLLLLNIKTKFKYIYSWLLTIILAFADELNQYFMVGRSGRALDIILDATAGLIILILVYVISKIRRKYKNNKRFVTKENRSV